MPGEVSDTAALAYREIAAASDVLSDLDSTTSRPRVIELVTRAGVYLDNPMDVGVR